MKFNIMQDVSTKTINLKVKPGWSAYNGFSVDYLDFESDIFVIQLPDGENIYIQQIVTFSAPKCDGDYAEAYMMIRQNNPNGDHDEGPTVVLDLNVAIDMVFERV
jgi:hypothetical protein